MNDSNIDLLLKEKENELREIQLLKIKTLENTIQEKEGLCHLLNVKYQELQKDFEYNFELIQEKDNDIEELKEKMYEMKEILEQKNDELDQVRAELEKLETEKNNSITELKSNLIAMKEKIKDLKQENQYLKSGQTEEMERNREESQKQIKVLQNIILGLEKNIKVKDDQLQEKIKATIDDNKTQNENLLKIIEKMKVDKNKVLEELASLKAENTKLRDDMTKNSKLLLDKEHQSADKITELKLLNKELDVKNEEMFKELESLKANTDLWNNTLQDKLEQLRMEKEELMERLMKKKLKYKTRAKQYEEELKTLAFDKEKLFLNEKLQKERMNDVEVKLQKEKFSHEEQIARVQKNLEEDMKKLKNEIELKEFQIATINNEKAELQKKLGELREENKKKDEKLHELDKENKILIDTVANQRHALQNIQVSPIKRSKEEGGQKNVDPNKHIHFSPPEKPEKDFNIEETDEVMSIHESMFTGDLGPVSPMPSNDFAFRGANTLRNSSKKKLKTSSAQQVKLLLDQIKNLQDENEELKERIRDMAEEVKGIEHRVRVSNHEIHGLNEQNNKLNREIAACKEETFAFREKNMTLQAEKAELEIKSRKTFDENHALRQDMLKLTEDVANYRRMVETKESQISTLKTKLQDALSKNESLRSERDKLIEISSNLRSEANRLRDKIETVESRNLDDEDNNQGNPELEEELAKFKERDIKNLQIIEKLKRLVPQNMKLDFGENVNAENILNSEVPEKDMGPLDAYKNRMEEVRKELYVKSSQKPLVGQPPVNVPNSQKATASQKEIDYKLKNKKKKSPPPKSRNYNIREDDF